MILSLNKEHKKEANSNNELGFSEIICLYNIQEKKQNDEIGKNIKKSIDIDILINDTKI